jgi:hypothetical protein
MLYLPKKAHVIVAERRKELQPIIEHESVPVISVGATKY